MSVYVCCSAMQGVLVRCSVLQHDRYGATPISRQSKLCCKRALQTTRGKKDHTCTHTHPHTGADDKDAARNAVLRTLVSDTLKHCAKAATLAPGAGEPVVLQMWAVCHI